ncbi:MAG: hypothetical protein KF905_02185 [Flavobacteriales bacterium]|nr:hypothetical protein [Flavobacteriales bacterium]
MTPGIRNTVVAALAWGGLLHACQQVADPQQLRTLDEMINTVESALLTLNELDAGRYHRADSVFTAQQEQFSARFKDTLDRRSADLLGNHYLLLRSADRMAREHDALLAILKESAARLRALRLDIGNGLMDETRATTALATERVALQSLQADVDRALDNYRSIQRAWEEQDRMTALLEAGTHNTAHRP